MTLGQTDVCAKCKTRRATLDWVGNGGTMAYIHGMSVRWCERCAIEAQLAHAIAMAEAIQELKSKLEALP